MIVIMEHNSLKIKVNGSQSIPDKIFLHKGTDKYIYVLIEKITNDSLVHEAKVST